MHSVAIADEGSTKRCQTDSRFGNSLVLDIKFRHPVGNISRRQSIKSNNHSNHTHKHLKDECLQRPALPVRLQ